MLAIVTPEEMAAIDAAAPEPVTELIERAGAAVARSALELLGGAYGRRVVVVAGKGNNGADGRSAAVRLRRRGVRVEELGAADLPDRLPDCDLVIDAAYGTGFRGRWDPPPAPAPVLAVDIPTGLDGLTGAVRGSAWPAVRTCTFAALKPGLLLADGPGLAGEVEVADIGLDVSSARRHLVEAADVARWIPERARDTHKWRAACWIIAGSPGMTGAAVLAARGAQRAGAGYVRLSGPGLEAIPGAPVEVVEVPLPGSGWAAAVLVDRERVAAMAVGPGLGRADGASDEVEALVRAEGRPPLVIDGDGLSALADGAGAGAEAAGGPTILTPHDGEAARLGIEELGGDRLRAVDDLAERWRAVVLAKGAPTVVADPGGDTWVVASGDSRLATAGTGDVLTGALTALLAQGLPPARAAAAAAYLHGRAGALAWRRGLVAGDVAEHLPAALAELPGG